ncbi:sialidase family protein [Caulobacter hibisci]|uniref:Exo-alpha-sialidase n=1 Tax=Caulobacter hibisci TaxID=2035993 RepID=A0ABS0T2U1_9CAUL|nr:sialidase family protein [Caulobacter hibisci]MBI1686201.1 exo-alpha-sialidase [Caulobacter hibisci]
MAIRPASLAAVLLLTAAAAPPAQAQAQAQAPPYAVAPGLFQPGQPDLGLSPAPGAETFTVFAPTEASDKFSNGVALIAFKHRLYAQWQSSARDEDSADTWVAYSASDDGRTWSPPRTLAPAGTGGLMRSSGGWQTDGKTLVAYANVWPGGFQSGAGGHAEYRTSRDGRTWSPPRRVTGTDGRPVEGVIEQDPHLVDGRVMTAFHLRPGMIAKPFFTDDPLGVSGWIQGRMESLPRDTSAAAAPHEKRLSREIEPSLFRRADGCAVMVFRDEDLSFRQLASQSCDRGVTWTTPALTAMPDARAKQSAGNLPDGTAYLVNAPNTDRPRLPLAVTTSPDGRLFDRSWRLRGQADLQPLRFEGQYKRPSYHYPKSVVWNGWLYAGYAANKEDVQVTRVPVKQLQAPLP